MLQRCNPLLLALLSLILCVPDTQQQQQLNLDALSTFSSASTLTLPSHNGDVAISVALCGNPDGSTPRVIFTNSSTRTPTDVNVGTQDVFEILIDEGVGSWVGSIGQGGRLAVTNTGQTKYEVGVSTNAGQPFHQYLGQDGSLFGDSTGNQAIFFSPPFESVGFTRPTYPNYTLPSVQMPFSVSQPSSTPQFALTLVETSSISGLLRRSSCALRATSSKGTVKNQMNWIRDAAEGWRSKWLVEGLTPGTNYSAFVFQDGTKVSGPLYFTTKSASFNCPLVDGLSYCPGVSWAVPLPAPPNPDTTYNASNLPTQITDSLQQYIANFTIALTTIACGRSIYSPIQTCADCQREYRRWVCAISLPRCGEPRGDETSLGRGPSLTTALASPTQQPRNQNFPRVKEGFVELLPCLETCQATDRACPNHVGFQCPLAKFNADKSYGVGFIDSRDGDKEGGLTGVSQDVYGNVWCNSG
ncbi:hypothetical protein BDM02DRAFT_1765631 [Thelephora ganbajun]|uniref:Uncharacterized protein n=1 Tax=Thelephora ganbajun TaxID=370292 RepID=A0ACB6ZJW8_THEGA|nr:hypothetical protein BDM02DRAFT_1765631 [Thelephora ganbajun]